MSSSCLVLDTNVLIRLFEGKFETSKVFSCYDEVVLPTTVIGEYRAGIFPTRKGETSQRKLEFFLQKPSVKIVPVVERTAEMYAKVYQALRKEGRPIPQNDMWIAASALEHCADIATFDEHFKLVPMLTVLLCG